MAQRKRMYRDWPAVLQAQQASGLTVAAFCRQHGISRTLFQHRRRQAGAASSPFVELRPAAERPDRTGIALLSGAWRIEVQPDFDAATLARVCACLGGANGACSA